MCRSWTRTSTGVSAAQADVVQPAVVPQGELAVGVDPVVAHPEVAVDGADLH
jgi:hypothetical protein